MRICGHRNNHRGVLPKPPSVQGQSITGPNYGSPYLLYDDDPENITPQITQHTLWQHTIGSNSDSRNYLVHRIFMYHIQTISSTAIPLAITLECLGPNPVTITDVRGDWGYSSSGFTGADLGCRVAACLLRGLQEYPAGSVWNPGDIGGIGPFTFYLSQFVPNTDSPILCVEAQITIQGSGSYILRTIWDEFTTTDLPNNPRNARPESLAGRGSWRYSEINMTVSITVASSTGWPFIYYPINDTGKSQFGDPVCFTKPESDDQTSCLQLHDCPESDPPPFGAIVNILVIVNCTCANANIVLGFEPRGDQSGLVGAWQFNPGSVPNLNAPVNMMPKVNKSYLKSNTDFAIISKPAVSQGLNYFFVRLAPGAEGTAPYALLIGPDDKTLYKEYW